MFPTPAEYENYQQNQITTWVVNWLSLGSSAGAADAHIVETDATGRSALVGLDLNDAIDETVLNVTGVNTIAPTAVYTCTTGATVVQAAVGNSTGTAFSASVGTGAGTGLDATLASSAAGGTKSSAMDTESAAATLSRMPTEGFSIMRSSRLT